MPPAYEYLYPVVKSQVRARPKRKGTGHNQGAYITVPRTWLNCKIAWMVEGDKEKNKEIAEVKGSYPGLTYVNMKADLIGKYVIVELVES